MDTLLLSESLQEAAFDRLAEEAPAAEIIQEDMDPASCLITASTSTRGTTCFLLFLKIFLRCFWFKCQGMCTPNRALVACIPCFSVFHPRLCAASNSA